jgi:hypothetical protein
MCVVVIVVDREGNIINKKTGHKRAIKVHEIRGNLRHVNQFLKKGHEESNY